jgi:Ca2+-binding EF-hand superfamily protein
MIVTSLTELAASVRSTLTLGSSNTAAASSNPTPAPARETDTVDLSASRAETLMTALDKDGDGLVSKEEFAEGAIELLKRASVRFHHQHAGGGKSIEKRDDRWTGRLEDVFAHVDENHDGAIDLTELTSALPKPAQRPEQRQSCSSTQTSTGSPTTVTATASVTVVAVAIRRYVTS